MAQAIQAALGREVQLGRAQRQHGQRLARLGIGRLVEEELP
jgi:hypothetical protein